MLTLALFAFTSGASHAQSPAASSKDSVVIEVEAVTSTTKSSKSSKSSKAAKAAKAVNPKPAASKATKVQAQAAPPPQPPSGLSEKEQRTYDHWVKFLADPAQSQVAALSEACGGPLKLSISPDFTTEFMAANTHAAQLCDEIRATLIEICRAGRSEAVRAQIASVACRKGAQATMDMSLEGRRLIVRIGLNAPKLRESLRERLGALLSSAASTEAPPRD
jgi:hypothetical protein